MFISQEQYIFIHNALLEAITVGDTAVPCYKFKEMYGKLKQIDSAKGTNKLQEQFKVIQRRHFTVVSFAISVYIKYYLNYQNSFLQIITNTIICRCYTS